MAATVPPPVAKALDRRFGGTWTRAQALKNRAIRIFVQALLFAVDRMPRAMLVALGATAGRVARALDSDALTRARARTAAASTASSDDVASDCFVNAGRALATCALLRRDGVRAGECVSLSDESRAVLLRALSAGRGAIVLSAHVGPFEMIPARLVEAGFAPSIVVRESYDPLLDPVVDDHRRRRGIEVIHRGKAGAALRIVRALRRGRPVGVLPDLGGRGLATLPARFLGRTVAFPVGPQQLAHRTGCPLVMGTLARTSGASAFELILEDLASDGTLAELTQRVADALARAIVRSPADWLWMTAPHLAIAADPETSLFSGIIHSAESGRA
ncbi:MAG TPA: lysophospholipid acyltransferase family protein [Polyangiaceae bacterium]|jgi:KDO2-lipid IV(A) lauroyltransferase|nr:lysophospholipid acyltransferase family protein [Polyangiaceae bacterium]